MIITIARKPLSEGTVASNVLEHETGAVNIDAGRITCRAGETLTTHTQLRSESGYAKNEVYGKYKGGFTTHQTEGQKLGRWPANFILQHKEGCECVGTRQGKGYAINRWSDGATPFGGGAGHPYDGEAIEGILEDIWECVEGCPIPSLDEQSGGTKGDMRAFTGGKIEKGLEGKGEDIYTAGWRSRTDIKGTAYADSGGASRFFKQVKG